MGVGGSVGGSVVGGSAIAWDLEQDAPLDRLNKALRSATSASRRQALDLGGGGLVYDTSGGSTISSNAVDAVSVRSSGEIAPQGLLICWPHSVCSDVQ